MEISLRRFNGWVAQGDFHIKERRSGSQSGSREEKFGEQALSPSGTIILIPQLFFGVLKEGGEAGFRPRLKPSFLDPPIIFQAAISIQIYVDEILKQNYKNSSNSYQNIIQ